MILLKRGTVGVAVVTVSEKATLTPTRFTLTFTHDLTGKTVEIVDAQDTSLYPDRYNAFLIDTSLFVNLDNGFFTYRITDQLSSLLELGKCQLVGDKETPVEYTGTPSDYETYGQ